MTAQSPPFALQSASHSAELFRRAMQSLLSVGGVIGTGDLAVTANGTPNMSVNVAAGQIWIPGSLGAATGMPSGLTSQGSYYGYNDGIVNLTIAAANATNPRIDLVVASVQDQQYSGTNNQWIVQVVTGTPAASPVPPAAPASSIPLAQVAVAANATSIVAGNITDERPRFSVLPDYHARAHRSGGFTSSGTAFQPQTAVFETVDSNPGGGYSAGTGLYTCPVPGRYRVSGVVTVASGAGGHQEGTVIMHNAVATAAAASGPAQASGQYVGAFVADTVTCAAGDTLSIEFFASAANLTGVVTQALNGGLVIPYTYLSIDWVGNI